MKKKYVFLIRRIIAVIAISILVTMLLSIVVQKGIDAQIEYDRVMMQEHKELWGIK